MMELLLGKAIETSLVSSVFLWGGKGRRDSLARATSAAGLRFIGKDITLQYLLQTRGGEANGGFVRGH